MDLTNLNDIKHLLAHYNFHFSKKMGQNFIIDNHVLELIVSMSGLNRSCGVLEIGPGIGSLTCHLAKVSDKVVSIELDRSLIPILFETLSTFNNVEIIHGDIMKLDLMSIVKERFQEEEVMVCANLPYNITTPVITKLLTCGLFSSITVMVQREVAKRICADSGNSDYGFFSVFCQYYAKCSSLFDVTPDCFFPSPKVTSSVIQIVPRSAPPVNTPPEDLFKVVKASFTQRRKTLVNSLGTVYGNNYSKDELKNIISQCGLPKDIRGECLSLNDFSRLADKLSANH